jgi:Flp pilus assembly protein TadG
MNRRQRTRAQSMVEFALIAPAFFLLLLGIMEMGRLLWVNHTIANAAREGARYVMVSGSEAQYPYSEADVKDQVQAMAPGVTIAYEDIAVVGLGGSPGSSGSVTVDLDFQFIVAEFLGLDATIPLSHTSTIIIQH